MIAAAVKVSARDLLNRAKDQLQKGNRVQATEALAKVQEFGNLSQLGPVEQSILNELRVLLGNVTPVAKPRTKRKPSGT